MDSNEGKIPPLRGVSLDPKQLTIMVIRSVGKIRSFKISRRLIFLSSLFIIFYILASIYVINSYFDLRYRHNAQSKKLEQLENENSQNGRELLRSKHQVALLEDYIKSLQMQKEREKEPVQKKDSESQNTGNPGGEANEDRAEIEKSYGMVKIEDFAFHRADSALNVNFRLVNAEPGDNAMEGFVHIIPMNNEKDLFPEWSYTKNMLNDGFPSNYRRGQPFLIQRFKPYHRTFIYNTNAELPSIIRLVVYDISGTLLLDEEFETSNES